MRLSTRPWRTSGIIAIVLAALIKLPAVLADTAELQPSATDRSIWFSGHMWHAKDSKGELVGPGPNRFAAGNVWSANDKLHLRIADGPDGWQCAEVVTSESFGYGTYTFVVDTDAAALDANVVLGLFTWSDNPDFAHREIDIEISRWGDPSNRNAQCVVQPYDLEGHISRFIVPPGQHRMRYDVLWTPNHVTCAAAALADATDEPARLVHEREFSDRVPPPGDENAHINFWLSDGKPPANSSSADIVIESFSFRPLTRRQPD